MKRKWREGCDNRRYGDHMEQVPRESWPVGFHGDPTRIEVWRNRRFLAQVFMVLGFRDVERISVCRTMYDKKTREFMEVASWDDLQLVKREIGRGDREAIEIYPSDHDVVNVANFRHLWVLPEGCPFTWKARRAP